MKEMEKFKAQFIARQALQGAIDKNVSKLFSNTFFVNERKLFQNTDRESKIVAEHSIIWWFCVPPWMCWSQWSLYKISKPGRCKCTLLHPPPGDHVLACKIKSIYFISSRLCRHRLWNPLRRRPCLRIWTPQYTSRRLLKLAAEKPSLLESCRHFYK